MLDGTEVRTWDIVIMNLIMNLTVCFVISGSC